MKALFLGSAAAAVAGLWLGGFSQPQLRHTPALDGPRLVAPNGSDQFTQADWIGRAYPSGRVPDYVLGTDWTAPNTPAFDDAVYEYDASADDAAQPIDYAAYEAPPAAAAPVVQAPEPQPQPIALPSLGGGVVAAAPSAPEAPQPQQPPQPPFAPAAPELG